MRALPPFDRVIQEHAESVLRYLVAAVGGQDAEDCFQETFVAALRAYPTLRDTSNLRAWMLTIAQRKAIDDRRRRRATPMRDLPDRGLEPLRGDEHGLWDAVRALPPKQRAAVTQRYANDLSYADIARIVGCSQDAARQNVREGLKKLREVIDR